MITFDHEKTFRDRGSELLDIIGQTSKDSLKTPNKLETQLETFEINQNYFLKLL